jgi:beta-mannosidase
MTCRNCSTPFVLGGIYESDDFYELADEYGILLWHDFMFACSMYQANPDNLDNAREEVKHQVIKHFIHH